MTKEKFKYGPLVWNCIGQDGEDDEGNYYWPGNPPVAYDEMGLPVDKDGRQCLPIDCPFHPHYSFKDFITSKYGTKFPTSFKDYEEWLDKNFIVFDKTTVKRNIITKIITQVVASTEADNVYKMVRLNIKEVEDQYGESFTKKKVDLDANT
jgi:hypothetical protein